MNYFDEYKDIDVLIGQTIVRIDGDVNSEELIFTTDTDKRYKMYHEQDCCESVSIDDIVGDLNDLLDSPITMAEEATSSDHPEGYVSDGYEDSFTWTFYKLATVKGYVNIKWFGTSNGYYSERVSFMEI